MASFYRITVNLKNFVRALGFFEDAVAHFLHHLRAGVVVLVDSVAEAHELEVVTLILGPIQILLNVIFVADLLQHLQDCLVGSAVVGAPECGDPGGDAGEGVGEGGARDSDGGSRGILLMVRMQHENDVKGLHDHRVNFEVFHRRGEHLEP